MNDRKRPDPKLTALRKHRTLNPHPGRVTDEFFRQSEFFDPRDLLQVKYEMIRRVEVDKTTVADAAKNFGLSRPSFYEAREAFARDGLAGLLPDKRGPRAAHKLRPDVMTFIEERRASDDSLTANLLAPLVTKRFGIEVHPRSIERALRRLEKKGR